MCKCREHSIIDQVKNSCQFGCIKRHHNCNSPQLQNIIDSLTRALDMPFNVYFLMVYLFEDDIKVLRKN